MGWYIHVSIYLYTHVHARAQISQSVSLCGTHAVHVQFGLHECALVPTRLIGGLPSKSRLCWLPAQQFESGLPREWFDSGGFEGGLPSSRRV